MFGKFISWLVVFIIPVSGAFCANPELVRLINEKNKKYQQLEQCAKKVNGFKMAGVSTLGLTAAGVAGNVMLANKNKELTKQIDQTKTSIESEKTKKENLQSEIETKKQEREACLKKGSDRVDGNCKEKKNTSENTNSASTSTTVSTSNVSSKTKLGAECDNYDKDPFLVKGVWKEYASGKSKCIKADSTEVDCYCSATECFGDAKLTKNEKEDINVCVYNKTPPSIDEDCSGKNNIVAGKYVNVSETQDEVCLDSGKAVYCACSATKCNDSYKKLEKQPGVFVCAKDNQAEKFELVKSGKKTGTTSQEYFCNHMTWWRQNSSNGNVSAFMEVGADFGYWCKHLFGEQSWKAWNEGTTYYFECSKSISEDDCKKAVVGSDSKQETSLKSSNEYLKEYKTYKISGDEAKDIFKFIKDVDGYKDEKERLEEECSDKNGNWSCKGTQEYINGHKMNLFECTCKK